MRLVVKSPDELFAALPHLLGFRPEESLVLLPMGEGLPAARVDLPLTAADRMAVAQSLTGPFVRHAAPGASVAIAVVSHDRGAAASASRDVARQLLTVGVDTSLRLWSDGRQWADLDCDATGLLTQATAQRIASATVYAGRAQPAPSRHALAASLVGDRSPVARLLTSTPTPSDPRSIERACIWSVERVERFHGDGNRLDVADATRLLVALGDIGIRDTIWGDMTRENAQSHVALWTDLTRRAPDEVRAAPAALLGFASWLHGDGARAWCALDQVPVDQHYRLAAIVAATLENGVHPREWSGLGPVPAHGFASAFDEPDLPDTIHRRSEQLSLPPIPRQPPGPDR